MEVIPVSNHNLYNSGISSNNNSNKNNNNNNLTKLISQIQEEFAKNYRDNLESFIPTIHTDFLYRVSYTDETLKKIYNEKIYEELRDKQKNVDFRKQIYLDFVLDKMDKIFEIENKPKQNNNNNKAKEDAINKLYQKYSYDTKNDIEKPIKSLIKKSIIPNYNKIPKSDIVLYRTNSHGAIQRNIKQLQSNCIVIFITPLNRYTFFNREHLSTIDKIITRISKTMTDSNNIYDIIKMIEKYKCFDKSTIIYPNQYYFDYEISPVKDTAYCSGGVCYKPASNSFNNIKLESKMPLEKFIEDQIQSKPNKLNIFFVKGCKSANSELYDNFTIEKMYIYENFIKILNRSISKKLSVKDLPYDSSIDCKIRIESKSYNVLTKRTNDFESKKLILNSSLGSKISDTELYTYFLINMNYFNNKAILPSIIYNLLSKDKSSRFYKKIEYIVMIKFIEDIKKIIDNEPIIVNRQFYILNIYILLFYIIDNFYNYRHKDVLKSLNTKFEDEYEKYKNETNIDIDINIFKNLLTNKSDKTFDMKLLLDLFKLCNTYKFSSDKLLKFFFYNLCGIIQDIILEHLSIDDINNNESLLKKIDEIDYMFDMNIIKIKMDKEKLNNNLLYTYVSSKIKQKESEPAPAPAPAYYKKNTIKNNSSFFKKFREKFFTKKNNNKNKKQNIRTNNSFFKRTTRKIRKIFRRDRENNSSNNKTQLLPNSSRVQNQTQKKSLFQRFRGLFRRTQRNNKNIKPLILINK